MRGEGQNDVSGMQSPFQFGEEEMVKRGRSERREEGEREERKGEGGVVKVTVRGETKPSPTNIAHLQCLQRYHV